MASIRKGISQRDFPHNNILFAFALLLLLPMSGRATSSDPGYVGSKACASCHSGIYQSYKQTSMGRSMSGITSALLSKLALPAHTHNEHLGRRFDIYAQDGKLYESEYAVAIDGTEIFRDTHPIDWIVGAGTNGYGGLIHLNGRLFQGPQSFYSRSENWGPSPGYDFSDLGFNRSIQTGCISCHSGRVRPVSNSDVKFEDPPFSELAIGCENCHGPGADHVATMRKGNWHPGKPVDIVNPSKLTPYLADNICMNCHQSGDVRVLKPGKTYLDFRPGEPLDETLSILMVPPTPSSPPDADHVEHYYSMILSKCYRASQGRMSCITCHDPHIEPSGNDVPASFNARCLRCHTAQSCTQSAALRQQTHPADNCIGCHMPKRDIKEIPHSTATNHRILARPNEPFPDMVFHQTTPSLPDLIHLNPATGQENQKLPLLTLLQAYGELAATRQEYVDAYLKVLDELEKKQPQNALVQAALGRHALKQNNYQSAVDCLQLAIKLGSQQATTYADLSEAMSKLGQVEESLPFLQKAVDMDAYDPALQKALVVRYIQLKQYPNAQQALEHYLQIVPQDSFMRQMLARAQGKTLPQEAK